MSREIKWVKTAWYGTSDPKVTREFDTFKLRNGPIWLRVFKPEYMNKKVRWGRPRRTAVTNTCKYCFTVSFGHNSDCSFSGCLPKAMNSLSFAEAQVAVRKKVHRLTGWG